MRQALFFRTEGTGAFHHEIDTQFFPREVGRVTVTKHTDAIPVNDQILFRVGDFFNLHFMIEETVHGIMTQQVSVGLDVTHGVNRNDFDIVLFTHVIVSTKHVTADTAKTGNGNLNSHVNHSL